MDRENAKPDTELFFEVGEEDLVVHCVKWSLKVQ